MKVNPLRIDTFSRKLISCVDETPVCLSSFICKPIPCEPVDQQTHYQQTQLVNLTPSDRGFNEAQREIFCNAFLEWQYIA